MNINYISQAALGGTSPVNLGDLFTGEKGGDSFSLQAVSGTITIGMDNTVSAATGFPLPVGQLVTFRGQSFRILWAVGGATDRLAIAVLG